MNRKQPDRRRMAADRSGRILEFVRAMIRERGRPPSIREIRDEAGLASTRAVEKHLAGLERQGLVRRRPGIARGLELPGEGGPGARAAPVPVPLLGPHPPAGGEPLAAGFKEWRLLDPALLPGRGRYALLAVGPRMAPPPGLEAGDLALIRLDRRAGRGPLLAAGDGGWRFRAGPPGRKEKIVGQLAGLWRRIRLMDGAPERRKKEKARRR